MSEETIDYRKLAEALAEAGEEYRELVILRMRLSARVDSLAEELKAATARIAELSQALGLITTLKPTMVMDADHPLDMAKEVVEYATARIAELEAEKNIRKDQLREAKNILIDKKLQIDSLYEAGYKLQQRIAELEEAIKGHDPFEEFPPKERGFECSVMVLGKFEYEEEFTPFTNWDLCVYWFDEEKWHPLNGYVKGDDIVRWYALPPEVQ